MNFNKQKHFRAYTYGQMAVQVPAVFNLKNEKLTYCIYHVYLQVHEGGLLKEGFLSWTENF